MAQIREYNRQVEAVGPVQGREVSAASLGGGGQAIEFAGKALSHVAETVDKIQSQDDIIKGSKSTSEFFLQQTQALQDLKNSGKITEDGAYDKWHQDFTNGFSKLSEDMKSTEGRKFMAEREASYTQHFGNSFIKESADAKGAQAKSGFIDTLNNKSSALTIDPSAFQQTVKDMDLTLATLKTSGTMASDDVDKLGSHAKSTLALSAIQGEILKNPTYAKGLISGGMFDKYVTGMQKAELINTADVHIRGAEIEGKRVLADKEHTRAVAADAQMSAWLPDVHDNKLSMKAVYENDTLNFREKVIMQNMINKTASGLAKTDSTVALNTYKDIQAGKIVSGDQIDVLVGEGLSPKDAMLYKNILKERTDPVSGVKDFTAKKGIYDDAEKRLGKDPIAGLNPEAQVRMNSLRYEIEAAWIDGRKKGLSVQQLTDPKSPEYLGRLTDKYIPNSQEVFNMKYGAKQMSTQSGSTGIAVANKPNVPQVGEVKNGYMFKGGNPADKNSWEKK
jgi:hypothetical protein